MDTRKVAHELRRQHWSEIVNQRQASGQTVRQFCQEQGIKEKTYYYWQRKLRENICEKLALREETALEAPPIFAQVETSATAVTGSITIRRGGCEVIAEGDVSPAALEAVLRTLNESC